MALSSTEAEYKAACIAACEAVWLRKILQDIGVLVEEATVLKCDNQSCMAIAKNPVFINPSLMETNVSWGFLQ